MNTASETRSTLNDLIETCIDGQKGFETAAEAVQDPQLKNELMHYSVQRSNFASELQNLLAAEGDEPVEHGHASATLHRGWMNIRSAVSSHDPHAILAECERGEDSAVSAYKDALQHALQPNTTNILESQFAVVQATHDRVKELRDSLKYVS